MLKGRKLTTSCTSASVGMGSVPLVVALPSATFTVVAASTGASLLPLMVTVRVLEAVPPWPSDAVKVNVSVRLSPTPRPCTAGSALFSV